MVVRRLKEPADRMLLIVKVQIRPDDEMFKDSVEEAARLKKYNHPNIIKVIETFDIKLGHLKGAKLHAIVMDYCNGNFHFIYIF